MEYVRLVLGLVNDRVEIWMGHVLQWVRLHEKDFLGVVRRQGWGWC